MSNNIDNLLLGIHKNIVKIKDIELSLVTAMNELNEHEHSAFAHSSLLNTLPIVKDEYNLRTSLQTVKDVKSGYENLNNEILKINAEITKLNTEVERIVLGVTDSTPESNKTLTESGRKIYRHRSNVGSVLEFKINNQNKRVLIPDAIFRNSSIFDQNKSENTLTNFSNASKNGFWYINNSNEAPTIKNYTDSELDDFWSSSYDSNTSKQNSELWKNIDSAKSIFLSRLILVDNRPCYLPNFQILLRIYCEANNIDTFDESLPKYSNFALGDENPNGYWKLDNLDWVASSTQFSTDEIRAISFDSNCKSIDKTIKSAFIPILEL